MAPDVAVEMYALRPDHDLISFLTIILTLYAPTTSPSTSPFIPVQSRGKRSWAGEVEGSVARSFAARSSEGLRTGVFGEPGSASFEDLLLLLLLLLLRITCQKACDDMGND